MKFDAKIIALIIIGIVALSIVGLIWGSYNSLVTKNAEVERRWADVQAQYQRRFDLVPNLVNVAEGYAIIERETLTEITALRTQWQTSTNINQRVETANQFESTLSKLLLITENYPELRSSEQFVALQDNLVETENMVSVSRMRFNEAVRDYNVVVRSFPSNIIAGWFGFEQRPSFEAATGAENAPQVDINITR